MTRLQWKQFTAFEEVDLFDKHIIGNDMSNICTNDVYSGTDNPEIETKIIISTNLIFHSFVIP